MPVKIRLTRMGKKKQPTYRVVVIDSRKPRDGAYIEQIGLYDPRQDPSLIEIDNDKALAWLQKGAQPTERAQKLLEVSGAWTRFRVAKGDIHTIEAAAPEAAAEPEAPAHEPEIHVVGGDVDEPVAEIEAAVEGAAEVVDEVVVEDGAVEETVAAAEVAEDGAPDEAAASDEEETS